VDLVGGMLRMRQHGDRPPHVRRTFDDAIDRDLDRTRLAFVFLRDVHQGRTDEFLIDRVTVETIRLLHARKARIDVTEFAIGRSPRGTDERPNGELGLAALRGTVFGIAHLKTEVDRIARGEEVAFLRREEFHHRHRITHRHGHDRFSGGALVIAHDDKKFVEGNARFYIEMLRKNRPCELHIFAKGGHGFGFKNTKEAIVQWPDLAGKWLAAEGFLKGR
jgi:hypothetical protein